MALLHSRHDQADVLQHAHLQEDDGNERVGRPARGEPPFVHDGLAAGVPEDVVPLAVRQGHQDVEVLVDQRDVAHEEGHGRVEASHLHVVLGRNLVDEGQKLRWRGLLQLIALIHDLLEVRALRNVHALRCTDLPGPAHHAVPPAGLLVPVGQLVRPEDRLQDVQRRAPVAGEELHEVPGANLIEQRRCLLQPLGHGRHERGVAALEDPVDAPRRRQNLHGGAGGGGLGGPRGAPACAPRPAEEVRASRHQVLHHGVVPRLHGVVQRMALVIAATVYGDVCPGAEEYPHDVAVALLRGGVQRREAEALVVLEDGAVLQADAQVQEVGQEPGLAEVARLPH
mmetsp:Transcript_27793/g.86506  ORF Transcript_27793/g.86506 Transcript_27793/m.86506 type:complete len:340 (-) Transcript_27793:65-1084(-)